MTKYNITEAREREAAYRSLINPKLMDELKQKILEVILNLAEDLGTNTRYISAVVNVRFHMNYTSFVNKYRIEEAMGILTDRRYTHMKMEDISQMVGFANRQSFYAAFFKINGCTPREYKLRYAQRSAGADSTRK